MLRHFASRCASLGAEHISSDRSPRLPTDVFPISGCGSSSGYLCWFRCAIQKKFRWCGFFCAFFWRSQWRRNKSERFLCCFGQITCFAPSHGLRQHLLLLFSFLLHSFLPQNSETSTWRNPLRLFLKHIIIVFGIGEINISGRRFFLTMRSERENKLRRRNFKVAFGLDEMLISELYQSRIVNILKYFYRQVEKPVFEIFKIVQISFFVRSRTALLV